MKTILIIVITIFCLQIKAQVQKQPPKLSIYHLKGDYYIYTTYNLFGKELVPSNSMYLVTDEGVVMFDTPWDSTQFQPLMDSIEQRHHKKVVLCISTHYHEDRTGGLDFLKKMGVKTYSTQQTLDLCIKHGEKQAEFVFTGDTTFSIGGKTIEAVYTGEGHAPDNIVLWCGDVRLLYGGCLVKSTEATGLGNLSDANLKEWPNTIRKLMAQFPNPAFVIPGHFSWKSNKGLQHTLKLLKKG